MSTWTSTLPRFVPSVSEVATILIVPWSTRAFVGLWIVTWTEALLAALPKLNGSEPGANVNCQSPGWPAKSTVSATFPVFRTTIAYETEPPAAIVRRCDASHVRVADRLRTFVSARFAIVSALTATDKAARYTTGRPFSVDVVEAEIVYTSDGRKTWYPPLESAVTSTSAPEMIVSGADTGAPKGLRSVPDRRNPCVRVRSRPNVAAWGTMIRARNAALPNSREAYTSYVPGAREMEYEPLESANACAEIAPPPRTVKVMLASTPRPERLAVPETVVLSSVRGTARSSRSEA